MISMQKSELQSARSEAASGANVETAGAAVRYRPWLFFAIDFAITWIPLWTLVVGMRRGWLDFNLPFMLVAGTSATVVAAVFVHVTRNRSFVRNFWSRACDPRRIAMPWWLFIIFFQLVINGAAILLSTLWGGSLGQFQISAYVAEAPVVFGLMTLLYGPLPEELGWRGYGLDALRTRMNLLEASLVLAAFWGLWHLPLHFMPGSFQQGLLEYPPALIAYIVAFFPGSIIMSWVYYRTGRSTLTAILIHYFGNLSGELFRMGLETRVIQTVLALLLAGIILWREWPMFTQREFYLSSGGAKRAGRACDSRQRHKQASTMWNKVSKKLTKRKKKGTMDSREGGTTDENNGDKPQQLQGNDCCNSQRP